MGGLLNQLVITLWRSIWLFSSCRSLRQDLCYLLHFANNLQIMCSSAKNSLSPEQRGKWDLAPQKKFTDSTHLCQTGWFSALVTFATRLQTHLKHSDPRLLWRISCFPRSTLPIHAPLSHWLLSLSSPSSPHHYLYRCPPSSLSFSC